MEQAYLLKAAAYVELNPVKAKMVKSAWDYRWSSVHAHIKGKDPQGIVDAQKLLDICGDWESYLMQSQPTLDQTPESHLNTSRLLGSKKVSNIPTLHILCSFILLRYCTTVGPDTFFANCSSINNARRLMQILCNP